MAAAALVVCTSSVDRNLTLGFNFRADAYFLEAYIIGIKIFREISPIYLLSQSYMITQMAVQHFFQSALSVFEEKRLCC